MNHLVRAEYRELAPALQPLRRAEQAVQAALFNAARKAIDLNLERFCRRPEEAARRFLARLDAGDDLATFRPTELGPLRGTVLRAGHTALGAMEVSGRRRPERAGATAAQH